MNAHVVPAQIEAAERRKAFLAKVNAAALANQPKQITQIQEQPISFLQDEKFANVRAFECAVDSSHNSGVEPEKLGETEQISDNEFIVRSVFVKRKILHEVARASGISAVDIVSHRRTQSVIIPRHFAMWRMRKETVNSLPEIGRFLGGRDHTSVIAGIRKTELRMAAGLIPAALLATIPGEPT